MFFLWLCCCWVRVLSVAAGGWTHHAVLDRDNHYHLNWKTETNVITFQVEVATHGYVGFGLSPNGGMAGSDIVTGWVKDGKAFLQDRHATGNFLPSIDKQQDWELLSGSENQTHTVLQFKRKLHTCDPQDLPITNDTMRVIFGYHDQDPEDETTLLYHGTVHRGTRSVIVFQQKMTQTAEEENLEFWDALAENVTISEEHHTMYWCKIIKSPIFQEKQHVVKITPVIQSGHEGNVHHIILYQCLGATREELEPYIDHSGHECYQPNMPPVFGKCAQPYTAWAIGGEDMILPEHVGMPFGEPGTNYFMIELHYDNPNYKNDTLDQSGVRLHYTPKLRTYDSAILMLGSVVVPTMIIPPRQESFTVAGHCDSQCLSSALPVGGIRAISVILHSHLLGQSIKLRHFRNGSELPPIASDNHYDFNFQEYRYIVPEVTILPDDHLTVECIYNSSERNRTTLGGLSTKEEMCLAFLLYYPKIQLHMCTSVTSSNVIGEILGIEINNGLITSPEVYAHHNIVEFLSNYTWTNMTDVESKTRFGSHWNMCYRVSNDMKHIEPVTYPPITKPYVALDPCQQEPEISGIQSKLNDIKSGQPTQSLSHAVLILILFCILT